MGEKTENKWKIWSLYKCINGQRDGYMDNVHGACVLYCTVCRSDYHIHKT